MAILIKILLCILPMIGVFFGLGIVISTTKKAINEKNIQELMGAHPDRYQSLRAYPPCTIVRMLKVLGWSFIIICVGFISLIIVL